MTFLNCSKNYVCGLATWGANALHARLSLKVIHFLQMNAKFERCRLKYKIQMSGPIFYNTIAVNDFLLGHFKIDPNHSKNFCMQRGGGGHLWNVLNLNRMSGVGMYCIVNFLHGAMHMDLFYM